MRVLCAFALLNMASVASAQRLSEAFKPLCEPDSTNKGVTDACLDRLVRSRTTRLADRADVVPAGGTAAAKHAALLQQYMTLIALKSAKAALPAAMPAAIHDELQAHGLEETSPIVGELRVGPVVTTAGTVAGSQTNEHSSGSDALAHIVWQTAHGGSKDKISGGDFSVEGQVGLQPALTLLQTQSTGQPQLAAQFQQGLVIDVGFDGSAFTGNTEWSFVARGGFVRFGQLAQVVQSNGSNFLALPAGTSDQVAPYFEVGVRGALYDRPMPIVHLSMGTLSPRVSGEVAYRRDSRFSQIADALKISSPQDRIVFRFLVDGLDVIDKRTDPEHNKVFKVGFGFDYQRGWTAGIPAGFSFLIRGDADLLKILQGSHTES